MSREELDALIKKHEAGEIEPNNLGNEFKMILKLLAFSIIVGLIIYTSLGMIASFVNRGDLTLLRYYGEYYSGYGMFFAGFYFAISFFAGRGVFMGEMMRRAWTNSKSRDEQTALDDLRSFIGFRMFSAVLFFGTLFSFLLYYWFIPSFFL